MQLEGQEIGCNHPCSNSYSAPSVSELTAADNRLKIIFIIVLRWETAHLGNVIHLMLEATEASPVALKLRYGISLVFSKAAQIPDCACQPLHWKTSLEDLSPIIPPLWSRPLPSPWPVSMGNVILLCFLSSDVLPVWEWGSGFTAAQPSQISHWPKVVIASPGSHCQ